MDGDSWMNTYKDNPISQKFRDMFGGRFYVNQETDMLGYENPDGNEFTIPYDDEGTWNLIEQSVYKKENLLIKN
jgi:hypothetical protein